MTPDPTVTNEELAEMEERSNWQHPNSREHRRLIAALRASQEEVKQLQEYIRVNPMRACYEEAEAERDTLQAEVEELRGRITDCSGSCHG